MVTTRVIVPRGFEWQLSSQCLLILISWCQFIKANCLIIFLGIYDMIYQYWQAQQEKQCEALGPLKQPSWHYFAFGSLLLFFSRRLVLVHCIYKLFHVQDFFVRILRDYKVTLWIQMHENSKKKIPDHLADSCKHSIVRLQV